MAVVIGFKERVQRTLQDAGLPFETEKEIGGFQPDIVVKGPRGQFLVLELKARTNLTGDELRRASRQAQLMCDATGADAALVVVPDSAKVTSAAGVSRVSSLVTELRARLLASTHRRKSPPRFEKTKRTVFAAMPFDEKYDDVFFLGIVPAAKAVGAKAERIDQEEFNGDIVSKIHAALKQSIAVIADISEARPNCLV